MRAGFTVVLFGAAGTGKTTVISEWALALQARSHVPVARLMTAAAPTHAAGGRLRVDLAAARVPVSVRTVSAQFGLGTQPGTIDPVRIEEGMKKYHRRELLKDKGVIDEAMLLTPRRMQACAQIQRRVIERADELRQRDDSQ